MNNYWLNPATKRCDQKNTCGIGGYYNETINQCFHCPEGCHLCQCKDGCQTKEQISCSECLDGYLFDEVTKTCQLINCQKGFYLNPYDYNCYSCPSKCNSCLYESSNDAILCTSCLPGYFFGSSQGTCSLIETCDPGFYYKSNENKCYRCPKYCADCDYHNGRVICSTCLRDGLAQNGNCIPKPKCDNYSYFHKETHKCAPCPTNCTSCSLDSNANLKCTGCWGGVFFNKTNGSCDPQPGCDLTKGSFYNSTDNTCNKCPGNCSTCVANMDNTNVICKTCPTGMTFNETLNICVRKPGCSAGTYYENSDNNCYPCPINCTKCSKSICDRKVYCESCVKEAFFNISFQTCDPVPVCQSDHYYNSSNNTCNQCPERSSGCYINKIHREMVESISCYPDGWLNVTEKRCDVRTVCTKGTYFNNSVNECFMCPKHCSECFEDAKNVKMNNITCTACEAEVFFNVSVGFCQLRSVCHQGTYYNPNNNYCYDCPENCSECHYDPSKTQNYNASCLSCEEEAFFNTKNQTCDPVPTCQNTVYYNQTDNKCHKCPEYCKNCSDDGVTCYECLENAWFNPKNQKCITRNTCMGNTYYNETSKACLYCPYLCQSCNYDEMNQRYNNITCLECKAEGFFDKNSAQCEQKSQCRG